MQFSRGCPHLCNYCGQRGFWTRWRHRDPVRFAGELARLHREHGVDLRQVILVMTYSVVMFSIVVQGMTITPMITAAKKACGDA